MCANEVKRPNRTHAERWHARLAGAAVLVWWRTARRRLSLSGGCARAPGRRSAAPRHHPPAAAPASAGRRGQGAEAGHEGSLTGRRRGPSSLQYDRAPPRAWLRESFSAGSPKRSTKRTRRICGGIASYTRRRCQCVAPNGPCGLCDAPSARAKTRASDSGARRVALSGAPADGAACVGMRQGAVGTWTAHGARNRSRVGGFSVPPFSGRI